MLLIKGKRTIRIKLKKEGRILLQVSKEQKQKNENYLYLKHHNKILYKKIDLIKITAKVVKLINLIVNLVNINIISLVYILAIYLTKYKNIITI